jgi:hypothetical protein
MSPAGLSALVLVCKLIQTWYFCPCSRALNRSGKGLKHWVDPATSGLTSKHTGMHVQGWRLGGASGAFAPGADFEGAPKRQSPTGQTLIRSTAA